MGTAGRDRRVRSRIGKRRTPGQRAEDSDEDQRGAPASSSAAPVVVEDVDEEPQGEPASGSAGPSMEVEQEEVE